MKTESTKTMRVLFDGVRSSRVFVGLELNPGFPYDKLTKGMPHKKVLLTSIRIADKNFIMQNHWVACAGKSGSGTQIVPDLCSIYYLSQAMSDVSIFNIKYLMKLFRRKFNYEEVVAADEIKEQIMTDLSAVIDKSSDTELRELSEYLTARKANQIKR